MLYSHPEPSQYGPHTIFTKTVRFFPTNPTVPRRQPWGSWPEKVPLTISKLRTTSLP